MDQTQTQTKPKSVSMPTQQPQPQPQPQNRACDACRLHKVRCLPNLNPNLNSSASYTTTSTSTSLLAPSSSSSKPKPKPRPAAAPPPPCQRCARTGRECVFAAPQRRRQRKRTDTRVAELEREVQAMRALFDGRKAGGAGEGAGVPGVPGPGVSGGGGPGGVPGGAPGGGGRWVNSASDENGNGNGNGNGMDLAEGGGGGGLSNDLLLASGDSLMPGGGGGGSMGSTSTPPYLDGQSASTTTASARSPFLPDQDVVDKGIITAAQAEELYQIYNAHLVQHYPAVFFPDDTTAEDLRRTRPTLFLAVIAAAAGKVDPHLFSFLHSEVLQAYAYRTVINSEKSLELVQAMTVTCVWYFPPGKFSQLKFYEYIHMAVTMAVDLGLGQSPQTSRTRRGGGGSPEELTEEDIEKRRVFLVCYLISTGAAMSMRRPNLLRYNSWVEECLNCVATNEKAHKHDKTLVQWVKILKITEELHTGFSFDDIGNIANLSETRVQLMVNGFEKQLDAWKRDAGVDIPPALLITYHFTQVQLHELGLHDDHPPEDFRPPFFMDKIISIEVVPEARSSHIDSNSIIISNAHSLINIILRMDVEELRELPIYNFVRVAVCIVMLLKLHISSKSPQSKIGSVLEPQDIKLGFYLHSLVQKLHEAVEFAEFRAPLTFLGFFASLAKWYNEQENDMVFTRPVTSQATHDQCWLPPVPTISMTQFKNGANQDFDLQVADSQLGNLDGNLNLNLNLNEVDVNGWSGTAEPGLDLSGTDLVEDFYPYDDSMDFTDPAFDGWLQDPYQGMMLPDLVDKSQEIRTYDWGFSTAANGADGI